MIELAAELLVKLTVGVAAVVEVPFSSELVVFKIAGIQHWTSQSLAWSRVGLPSGPGQKLSGLYRPGFPSTMHCVVLRL
jgi:hypothetical protein